MPTGELRLGAAHADITPPLGSALSGWPSLRRGADLHRPLEVRSRWVSGGDLTVVVVTLGLLGLSSRICRVVRDRIEHEDLRATRYGHGILDRELALLDGYAAVADPFAWGFCGPGLTRSPADLVVPRSLELAELDTLALSVPDGLTIVGIGGGMVVDAAKYIALRRGAPLVLVPSITSSNAPSSTSIAVCTGGEPTGIVIRDQDPRVVVDLGVLGRADARLNRSGFATCSRTTSPCGTGGGLPTPAGRHGTRAPRWTSRRPLRPVAYRPRTWVPVTARVSISRCAGSSVSPGSCLSTRDRRLPRAPSIWWRGTSRR